MKMPVIDRIKKEDLTDVPEGVWIYKILFIINKFMESVHSIISGNISIKDNVTGATIQKTINKNDLNDYAIKNPLKGKPYHVIITQIYRDTGSFENFITAPYPSWIFEDNLIKIKNITGIDNTSNYKVTFLILGE